MVTKFVGKLRKFQSSGTVGGDRNKHSPLRMPKQVVAPESDDIISRLRRRAELYEEKGENATPGRMIELKRIAQELRNFAINIRLNEWSDMDEI